MTMHVEQHAKNQDFIEGANANPADIVVIYDALCSCDASKLLDAVLQIEIGQQRSDALSAARKEMLLCKLKADLEIMRNLAPCAHIHTEALAPGRYFEALRDMPWPKALAMNIWLPGDLSDHERYFILGQVFSAMTCGQLARAAIDAA